jgi:hypothetical protein
VILEVIGLVTLSLLQLIIECENKVLWCIELKIWWRFIFKCHYVSQVKEFICRFFFLPSDPRCSHCLLSTGSWIWNFRSKDVSIQCEISGFHSNELTVFWDVTLCSLVDRYQCFKGICCLHLHSSTLKVEKACSSKMLVHIYQTIWDNVPEDSNLHVCIHSEMCMLSYM